MYSSFIWIYIIPMLLISPIMTISMNSWFSIWMALEFNMMTFIPLIIFFNKFYKELTMKYFIIQSISSSILIVTSNFYIINMNNNFNFFQMMNLLINTSLLIKLGAPPFHYWFINMMNNLTWTNCFIISTWQKISPLILIMYNYSLIYMYIVIILSTLVGALFGINHQSIRLILSYSSINHMSWMMMNLMINENMLFLYFISYSILNFSIMLMLKILKIYFMNQLFKINHFSMKLLLMLNIMSLASLPPMFGFLMKWHSIFIINKTLNFMTLIILIMMSLFTFFYYIRLTISLSILYKTEYKINLINKMFILNKWHYYLMPWILTFLNLWMMSSWIF